MSLIPYKDFEGTTHNLEANTGDVGGKIPKHDIRALPTDYVDLVSSLADKLDTVHSDLGTIYVTGLGTLSTNLGTLHTDLATTIAGKLDILHTDLGTTIAGYVDGLEGLITSSNTKLDTLHTDLGTTIAGYVDGLEGLITSSNTKLDTLHTDLNTLGDIKSAVDGVEPKLDTLHTDLATTIAGKLDTLHTDLGTTIAGYVDGLEGLITSSNTKLDALAAPASGFYGSKTSSTIGTQVALASSQAILNGVWIKAKAANTGVVYVCVAGGTSTNGFPLNAGEMIFCSIANLATVYIDVTVSGEGVNYWGS